ncbi:Ig-like domain-containing protein [Paenibacillus sp. NPDC058898]|uniref:Ig-like domain-containing protein n=2 Tax=unclassified Paenibacillus TaxID=185978 RepID=UPI003BF4BAC3
MLLQGNYFKWRKQLMVMLIFVLVFGSFSTTFVPKVSAASGPTPGGLSGSQPVLWLKADSDVNENNGLLTGWADQSTDPVQFTLDVPSAQEAKTPKYNSSGVNFNPSIKFDNTMASNHYASSVKLIGDKQITFQSGYAVYKWPAAGNAGSLVGSTETINYGSQILGGNASGFAVGTGANSKWRGFKEPDRERFQLANYEIKDATNHSARVNGKAATIGTATFDPFTFTPVIGATAGSSSSNWYGLRAEVAEIILYDSVTSDDAAKIETYLAVKYGITLNNGESNYISTNDDTVWTADSTYKHNIAGIGRDDAEALVQKQSRSVNDGTQIAIGVSTLVYSNELNTGTLSDQQYLIWGDNGQDLTFDQQIGSTNEYHSQRVWKVQNTNGVGEVQIAIPTSAIPAGKKLLVSSNVTDFTSATQKELEIIDLNGVPHYAAKTTLNNGQFFTFGVLAPEIQSAKVEEITAAGDEIILTFDQEIDLADQTGFKLEINGVEVTIDSFEIGVDGKTLKLKTSEEITQVDAVKVSYEKSVGNLKGKNGAPVHSFDYLIAPPALVITEPSGDTVFVKKPEIKGTTTPGATVSVEIKDGSGAVIATPAVTVNQDGTWSFIPSADLVDGSYTIEVMSTKDGKTAQENKIITVDTTHPALTITEPSGSTVFVAKPEFEGATTPGATVTVSIKDGAGQVVGSGQAAVDGSGNWSFIPSADLTDGDYIIEVTATKDGKTSPIVTKNIMVDATNPALVITEPSGGKVFVAKPEIKGTATPGTTITVEIKDKDGHVIDTPTVTVSPDGTWSFTPTTDLVDGDYTIEVTATKDGKTSKQNKTITVDTTNPALVITEPSGSTVSIAKPEFKGTATPGATVTVALKDKDGHVIDTPTVTVNPDGTWSFIPSADLADGDYTIEVTSTIDGKNSTATKNISVDTVDRSGLNNLKLLDLKGNPIGLTPNFDRNSLIYGASVTNSVYSVAINPMTLDPNARIEISVNKGAWQDVASGATSDELLLNVGTNTIIVKITDQAGNVKEYTLTVTRASSGGNDSNSGGNDSNSGGNDSNSGGVTPTPTTPDKTRINTSVNGTDVPFATGSLTTSGDQKLTSVQVDVDKLKENLAQGNGQSLVIHSPNEGNVQVDGLTAATIKQLADKGASLEIGNLLAIYPVPGGKMDLSGVSKQLGNAALEDIAAHIDIRRSSKVLIDSARSKAKAEGYELLVDPVDLDMTFTHDGQTVRSGQLSGYAPKYIALPEGIDPNRITTGVIVNPDGTVFHVPTVVTKINSRYYALINDLRSHGSYSVIWNPQDFDDVKKHWGKVDVNNIAARLDLAGTGSNTFSPDRNVTRSEFAEIVVSGLGLMRQNVPNSIFPDVPESAWYQDAVTIANEFGIVRGYDNGNFYADQQITREQGMAMIARAYSLIDTKTELNEEQITSLLAGYKDAASVSGWAREDVALLVEAGIVKGSGTDLLSPKSNMTRAEVTALIARLLKTTNLIDK